MGMKICLQGSCLLFCPANLFHIFLRSEGERRVLSHALVQAWPLPTNLKKYLKRWSFSHKSSTQGFFLIQKSKDNMTLLP